MCMALEVNVNFAVQKHNAAISKQCCFKIQYFTVLNFYNTLVLKQSN